MQIIFFLLRKLIFIGEKDVMHQFMTNEHKTKSGSRELEYFYRKLISKRVNWNV